MRFVFEDRTETLEPEACCALDGHHHGARGLGAPAAKFELRTLFTGYAVDSRPDCGLRQEKNERVRFLWPKNHKRQMLMRMRGLEPPRGFPHTDLNRARLPIPPHPRGRTSLAVPFAT